MNRRTFLIQSFGWALAGLAAGSPLSKVLAASLRAPSARMAIIIDDIGRSINRAATFLEIPTDLTFAVLPHLPHSVALASTIHAMGHEILLHQPMEPFDRHLDPGPGALFVGDSARRIEKIIDMNIRAVPYVSGVNNHMGSRFTSNREEIRCTLQAIKDRGLFFIDSLTSNRSQAYSTACSLHMSSGRRDIFIDNHRHTQAILDRLYNVLDRALIHGHAIAIGHPYPETAAAIRVFCSEIQDTPVRMVPVSRLLTSAV